jgi:undecaprenyl diphosphate synthase
VVGPSGRLWKSVIPSCRPPRDVGPQQHDDPSVLRELRRPGRDRGRRRRDRPRRGGWSARSGQVNEKLFARYLYHPEVPEVDLFLRPSGEQRTSNYPHLAVRVR